MTTPATRRRISAEPRVVDPPMSANGSGPDKRARHYTDLGNAERLLERHGADLRYCHPWARWLVWDGKRWAADETGVPERRLKETLRALIADAHEIDDDAQRKKLLKHVLESERAPRIRGALELARSERGVPVVPADLDADPWLLNVANGTIDLRDGELRSARREDLLTNLAPVAFNPDATAPRWQKFLERVLPDESSRAFLQRYVGYSLAGVTVEQVLTILHGLGANGKSTFVETLLELLGDYGMQAPAETFLERRESIPNDVARLRGARLVAATEIAEGRRLNETLVKRMTGGDMLTARFMRGEWFEFPATFSVLLATNHKPVVRGTDEAIWRRIRLVPFDVTIPPAEREPELREQLRHEFPGILAWAVEGCLAWQRDGLGESDAVERATATYREDSDLLGAFIEDRCVVLDEIRAKASDLFSAYREWCNETGTQAVSQQLFGRRLSERGFVQTRDGAARWWQGIGIRHDEPSILDGDAS